jgi:predicted secreted protein
MASAPIAGIAGNITVATHIGRFMQWSIETIQDVNDASGFGLSSNWRANLPGMKGWRLSASGYLLDNDTLSAPNADFTGATDGTSGCAVVATARTGSTYGGTVMLTSFVVGTGINGNATFSLTGVGDGALTETWDETA